MKIEELRFQPISHLLESDVDLINKNAQPNMIHEMEKQREERAHQIMHNGFPEEPFVESLFSAFMGEANKETNLKEECIKLRFEKIALEDLARRLQEENAKKDELINYLTGQVKSNGKGEINIGGQYI